MLTIRLPKSEWAKAWRAMIEVAPVRLIADDPVYEVLPAHLEPQSMMEYLRHGRDRQRPPEPAAPVPPTTQTPAPALIEPATPPARSTSDTPTSLVATMETVVGVQGGDDLTLGLKRLATITN